MALSTLAWSQTAGAVSPKHRARISSSTVVSAAPPMPAAPQVNERGGLAKLGASAPSGTGAALFAATVAATRRQRRVGAQGGAQRVRLAAATAVMEKPVAKDAEALEKENEKLIEDFSEQVERINDLEKEIEALSNDGLRAKTQELRDRIKSTGMEESIVNEAFAVLREAVWRILELWYFDVQLLGGLVLHAGRLAEMKTGEGKTIVALLPTFLAALEDKGGVFVVTPNDYLSRRDAENVGQVLRFLGVTVGLVQSTMSLEERQEMYKNEVVYLTNAELGFDYLRDNLAVYTNQVVLSRPFYYCLVDEADSILIDEARTPLIISESIPALARSFETGREVANALENEKHYQVDEKSMNVVLTDLGEKVAQDLLGVDNMWDPEEAWILYTLNALKAKELFRINEQYIIRDGKVAIVDTFTGRVLEGRRWSDGMHQAIECKEQINVSVRSQVTASITYQSLFRLFPKLCAMTGTALTEAAEFMDIYNLPGTAVPTARPMVRRDYPDVVYKTEEAKMNAIVEEIVLNNERNGRPILVGTSSVALSEELIKRLRERGVEPQLLNARPELVARENETISQAGRLGMVTVATNMAGRGTDIILGGNHSQMAQLNFRARLSDVMLPAEEQVKVPPVDDDFFPAEIPADLEDRFTSAIQAVVESERGQATNTFLGVEELVAQVAGECPFDDDASSQQLYRLREAYGEVKTLFKDSLKLEREAVIKAGGLYVLGTTRHESRRIDNQLRGRAGRQGDPGTSRFFISLEDEVFRVFGGNRIESLMDRFRLGDEIPLQSRIVNDTLDRVQTAVEEYFKKIRSTLFEFDKVISRQRELTYGQRREYLVCTDDRVMELLKEWGNDSVDYHLELVTEKEWSKEEWQKEFKDYYGFDLPDVEGLKPEELASKLKNSVQGAIEEKSKFYNEARENLSVEAARIATVVTIDDEWKTLLNKMDALKQTVGLAMYKGSDPLKEYQVEGFKMYRKVADRYKARSVSRWLRSKPKKDLK